PETYAVHFANSFESERSAHHPRGVRPSVETLIGGRLFPRGNDPERVHMRKSLWITMLAVTACSPPEPAYRPLAVGDPVPDYAAPSLAGDTLALESLRGDPVMLNIWATWCPPCREAMPALQQLHERYGSRGLRIVGVSVDSRGAEDAIQRFLEEGGYTFTILHDASDAVSREFRTVGVPETFLIDPSGVIVRRWIGRFDPMAAD